MKKTILNAFALFFISTAYGKMPVVEEDSVKTYSVKEVLVTATRSEILSVDASSPIQLIPSELIKGINGTTITDILRFINGVYIKDYGAMGGVKNINLRGLSTENVLFLIDGNPINNAQYGSVDLGLIPSESIDRMEISYGGSSALYGGNALGGVINIITRRPTDDLHAETKIEGGSFNQRRLSVELQGRVKGLGLLSGMVREYGNDDFPFLMHRQNNSDTVLYRKNSDYQRTNLFLNSDYKFNDGSVVNATIQNVKFRRGDPGSINYPSIGRLNDDSYRAALNANINIANDFRLQLGGIYNYNNELYYDSLNYTYCMKEFSFHAQIEWKLTDWYRLLGGIEYNYANLMANGYVTQYDSLYNALTSPFKINPTRIQKSVFISNEVTVQRAGDLFDRICLFQTIRYDSYSEIKETALSPKIGLNIRVYRPYEIRLRGSYGKNFRVPTLNDLYFPMYSNSNLIPEHANAFDVGIIGNLDKSGMHTIQVTYFNIISKDKISYNANFIPYNLGKAENSGYEIRYDYSSSDRTIDGYIGFTFIDAVKKNQESVNDPAYNKQLPYVPKSAGTFGTSFETEIGRINLYHLITGIRYSNADNRTTMPTYGLTSISIEKKIILKKYQIMMCCTVNNIFDIDYQAVEGYPMPGRTYHVTIGLGY